MRRPQSAFGLVAVMTSLLVVTLLPMSTSAAFVPLESAPAPAFDAVSGRCTKWTSEFVPPNTIRVLRTASTKAPEGVVNTVQTVDFRDYVATVMTAEWPEHYPLETIKAGAIATKQFAWFYILNPRGKTKKIDGEQVCYDVVDSTIDQFYKPETRGLGMPNGPGPRILAALDATWDVSLRKFKVSTQSSRIFLTGYRSGDPKAACGADATGFKLFHNSAKKCGLNGLRWREILRKYLNPNLEIVTPGRHDVIGSAHGDAAAMVRNAAPQWIAHVSTPGRKPPQPGSYAGLAITTDGIVSMRSADMNADGREDLVWLKRLGPSEGKIKVALSNGVNYGVDEVWWQGDSVVPLESAKLLVGDFQADGRVDVAILGASPSGATSQLMMLKRNAYHKPTKLRPPVRWWVGGQHPDKTSAAWAGDVTGDGRADLIVRQNMRGGGLVIRTAASRSPMPSSGQRMHPIRTRFESAGLVSAKVKTTVGDANRDGRDDVIMLIGGSPRATVERLQGLPSGNFKRVKIWTANKSAPIYVRKTKLGAADIDYDGRTDLILYSEDGNRTRIRTLKTRYTTMKRGPSWVKHFAIADVRPL